jgi:aspartate/methionine/tyrosine aminotransferase
MVASMEQLHDLAAIAARYEVPIISDEVFNEFLFGYESLPRARPHGCAAGFHA